MNCYQHQDTAAVALCCCCHKALCSACTETVGIQCACPSTKCHDYLKIRENHNQLAFKNLSNVVKQKLMTTPSFITSIFFFIFSLAFVSAVVIQYYQSHYFDYFSLILSVVFMLMAVVYFFRFRKLKKAFSSDDKKSTG